MTRQPFSNELLVRISVCAGGVCGGEKGSGKALLCVVLLVMGSTTAGACSKWPERRLQCGEANIASEAVSSGCIYGHVLVLVYHIFTLSLFLTILGRVTPSWLR